MRKYDVVYILRNGVRPGELIYSLRSLEKNFTFRDVWFYGGCPENIAPDHYVRLTQHGESKWEKVSGTLKVLCSNDDITEDFWLFNDDFFVLKKITSAEPLVQGSLAYRCQKIREVNNGQASAYSNNLMKTLAVLKHNGCDRLDYALHVPMLINRKKAAKVIDLFPSVPMFRSLYGNYWHIGGTLMDDVKIRNNEEIPDKSWKYCSTTDGSFREGRVGDYIRQQFPEKSRYEI